MLAIAGTEALPVEIGSKRAQFNAAEKGGQGMALKIFMGAKPSPEANTWFSVSQKRKYFPILEIY
jgi:hypothetical protein